VFRYEVLNLSTNKLAAIGQTIQVFLSAKERTLELNKPDFYANWEEQQPWINA
jgi:acyl-CoA thioesterase FadM